MKTYIVARDYEDGHQLTRFVTTDDEKELRKHWTRVLEEVSVRGRRHERAAPKTVSVNSAVKKNDQSLPLAVVWKERQRRRRSVQSRTLSPFEGSGYCAARIRSVAERGAVSVEASIWIASYLLAILGLVKAAYSEQPLLWPDLLPSQKGKPPVW
jgi:hypothetical protein